MKIVLYGDKNGYFTITARNWLKENRLIFEEKDVSDEKYLEELFAVSEQYAVPAFVFDNEVVLGFDRGKLEAVLLEKKI